MNLDLFGWGAQRYDLHTPPGHYRHDHAFVIEELQSLGLPCRVLDVGCGTGVFLEKASREGFAVQGFDASFEMVAQARQRLGTELIKQARMQDLDAVERFDAVVCLGWTFNYCASLAEAEQILNRCCRALRRGGILILQVSHAEHATGELREDREAGPHGIPGDVIFLYRFSSLAGEEPRLKAQYVYACHSLNELLQETHILNAADAWQLARIARSAGFGAVNLYDSYRKEPFSSAVSPFLMARRE